MTTGTTTEKGMTGMKTRMRETPTEVVMKGTQAKTPSKTRSNNRSSKAATMMMHFPFFTMLFL